MLAAHRAGVRTAILPERNRKDVDEDVPEEIRGEMAFHFASEVTQVIEWALEADGFPPPIPEPIEEMEPTRDDHPIFDDPVVAVQPEQGIYSLQTCGGEENPCIM